ncbi:hypothetical protein ONS95_001735 [Cadophora gregata]|uniref:uncharacterized protein n=1 Tax=Cadophora gregata TaxID=51156 RepID=UPI0026DDC228|nr:uncharacterized protein ONS95_001735 [Cadophora gregata]KAK0111374.1 hypothetical protein ONS95_001735 [Cadophora gregata]
MNRPSPLLAQHSQDLRRREKREQDQQRSQRHQVQTYGVNPQPRVRAAQLEQERLPNISLFETVWRRLSVGSTTPGSPPFIHVPPNTPHSPTQVSAYANSDILTLSPSSTIEDGNVGRSWMTWIGAAFVVVLGVVLLGKQEDDVGSEKVCAGSDERASTSESREVGEVGRILLWMFCGVLMYYCWRVSCVLCEAAVAAITEWEGFVDGRGGVVRRREREVPLTGKEKGRSRRILVDEDDDELVNEKKKRTLRKQGAPGRVNRMTRGKGLV